MQFVQITVLVSGHHNPPFHSPYDIRHFDVVGGDGHVCGIQFYVLMDAVVRAWHGGGRKTYEEDRHWSADNQEM